MVLPCDRAIMFEVRDTTDEEVKFLQEISCDKIVLELGTFQGGTTRKLAETAIYVHTVDKDEYELFTKPPENVIKYINTTKELIWNTSINVLFIDAGHKKEEVIADFEKYSPYVIMGGFVLFHDYFKEEGVTLAIKELRNTGKFANYEERKVVGDILCLKKIK